MTISSKGYHQLILWQKMRELLVITYELVDKLPKSEDFCLKLQMKRAMVSIMSNFVEGYLKASPKEKLYFLEISVTSLLELEAQAEICLILNFWSIADFEKFDKKRSEVGYFLFRYKSSVQKR